MCLSLSLSRYVYIYIYIHILYVYKERERERERERRWTRTPPSQPHSLIRMHQTCHFRRRATSVPAERGATTACREGSNNNTKQ